MRTLQVKELKNLTDLLEINPILFMVLGFVVAYCYKRGLPCRLTRVIDGRIPGVSVSDTHEEGRAFDMSIHGWGADDTQDFVRSMNEKYAEQYGALSLSDNQAKLVVYHVGTAAHFHVQIRKGL